MAALVQNDDEAQFFYNSAMIRDQSKKAVLLGVVDSKSFAGTDIDYFVGNGCLDGVMGLSTSSDSVAVEARKKWNQLSDRFEMGDERSPLFFWIDAKRPDTGSEANHPSCLQMDDVVCPLSTKFEDQMTLHAGVPRSGMVLLIKICGALAAKGYPVETISKVSKLVCNNLMTGVSHDDLDSKATGANQEDDWVSMTTQAVLGSLLDSEVPRKRSVHMNSNEVVLFINSFGDLHHEQLKEIVQSTLMQLQTTWNIWPVRVYAGPFLVGEVDEVYRRNGFSVTLLNVVNTDIGGPSMIDLLDAVSEAPIWSYQLNSFFKQIWRDRELVDRYDTGAAVSRSSSSDSVSQMSEVGSDEEELAPSATEPMMQSKQPDAEPLQHPDQEGGSLLTPDRDTDAREMSRELTTAEPTAEDESLWDDVRASYDSKSEDKVIAHPTFSHPSSEGSLLDLVRSQAEGIQGGSGQSKVERTSSGKTDTRGKPEKSDADDFVVL